MTTILRPYQSKIVKETSDLYKSDILGVMMQMSTGLGKTRTAAYIVDKYASTGRQVLWIVHREELLMQAAMTFAENGVKHRMICALSSERAIKAEQFREFRQCFVDPRSHVIIASIQTIVRRIKAHEEYINNGGKPENAQLAWLNPSQIVADEAHLSLAATWRKVIGHWPESRLLGLSATPTRLDKQSFLRSEGGLYDAMVNGPSMAEAIAMGALSDYVVYAPPVHFKTGVKQKMKGGDYDPKTLEQEFDTPVIYGDVIEHYRIYSHGKPAIGFCPTVKVAEDFAQAFRDAGYRAIALDGETDDTIRRRSLKQLATGDIDVIMSVSILVEGTDVPYATTAIWLRRTTSLSVYLQGTGRVLRPHPQKERAIILDFVGVTQIHGFPDDEREWSLNGEVKRKRRPGEDESPDVLVMRCTECFAEHKPAPVCPECEHKYPLRSRRELEQVQGNLVMITPEQRRAAREAMEAEKREAARVRGKEESQCRTLEDWIELAKARDYKFGVAWAKKRFRERSARKIPIPSGFNRISGRFGVRIMCKINLKALA